MRVFLAETAVLNVLQRSAGQTAAMDIGYRSFAQFTSEQQAQTRLLWLLGADDTNIQRSDLHEDCFIVYQGHHGDAGAEIADLVLPAGLLLRSRLAHNYYWHHKRAFLAAYTEKPATWVNTEGRSQRGAPAILPPGDARIDWKIIRAISEVANAKLPYDNLDEIRRRLVQVCSVLCFACTLTKPKFRLRRTLDATAMLRRPLLLTLPRS